MFTFSYFSTKRDLTSKLQKCKNNNISVKKKKTNRNVISRVLNFKYAPPCYNLRKFAICEHSTYRVPHCNKVTRGS